MTNKFFYSFILFLIFSLKICHSQEIIFKGLNKLNLNDLETLTDIDFTSKLYLDNGYDSALYNVKPLAYISIAAYYQYSENKSFKLMLDPIIQYGGSVLESACYDDFRRAYHCGTGLNWTDAVSGNNLKTYDLESFIKIKFKLDF